MHLSHRRTAADTELEVSPLLTQYYACSWSGIIIINLTMLWSLGDKITIGQGRYAHWCNSGISVTGVSKHFLIGFKVYHTRRKACLMMILVSRTSA